MTDVKWTSPTDLTVSGAATYTQADLDAAVNEALERAKREARVEGMRAALAIADAFDNPMLTAPEGYVDATQAIAALIEKEGK